MGETVALEHEPRAWEDSLAGHSLSIQVKSNTELTRSQKGALDKFIIKDVNADNGGNLNENDDNVPSNVPLDKPTDRNASNSNRDTNFEINVDDIDHILHDESVENDDNAINHAANVKNVGFDTSKCDMYDPRNWDKLDAKTINDLAVKGPKRDLSIENRPNDKLNRHFSSKFYTRILPNYEKCDREWLVYSKDFDKVFCFCCKLFRKWQG
ncbi:uncharacterized protein LOC141634831 [Silene latifolia]|uniref:uncharacterized protein LOC141634831 n=1 Tax=Silene latifolia TaxID=37657 RepID=UPI003D7822CB